jgi:hypothetical protein
VIYFSVWGLRINLLAVTAWARRAEEISQERERERAQWARERE